jgi:hypothetical protein
MALAGNLHAGLAPGFAVEFDLLVPEFFDFLFGKLVWSLHGASLGNAPAGRNEKPESGYFGGPALRKSSLILLALSLFLGYIIVRRS